MSVYKIVKSVLITVPVLNVSQDMPLTLKILHASPAIMPVKDVRHQTIV